MTRAGPLPEGVEIPDDVLPLPRIRLDWKAYFRAFCEKHGPPVAYNTENLLFPDGWMYSHWDYRGPEFRPPEKPEELKALQMAYWRRRQRSLKRQLRDYQEQIEGLKVLQSAKDASLVKKDMSLGNDGEIQIKRSDVDLSGLETQVLDLQGMYEDAKRNVNELENGREADGPPRAS